MMAQRHQSIVRTLLKRCLPLTLYPSPSPKHLKDSHTSFDLGTRSPWTMPESFKKASFWIYIHEGGYTFDVRQNERFTKIDWLVPLPQSKQNWTNLVGEDIIILGHFIISSFLKPSNNAPSANFVSVKNLLGQCPHPFYKPYIHPTLTSKSGLIHIMEKKGGCKKWMYLRESTRSNIWHCDGQVRY